MGIACIAEIVSALARGELGESVFEGLRDRVEGPWFGFADERFQLGENLFDRVEVGGVFWQEKETCAGGSDGFAHGLAFVRAEVVGHDDVVRFEGWDQELPDVGEEPLAVDWAVEETGRLDAIAPQRGEKRRGFQCPWGTLSTSLRPRGAQP